MTSSNGQSDSTQLVTGKIVPLVWYWLNGTVVKLRKELRTAEGYAEVRYWFKAAGGGGCFRLQATTYIQVAHPEPTAVLTACFSSGRNGF